MIGVAFFGACLVGSCLQLAYIQAVGFFVLFLLSALLLIAYGPVELSSEGIQMVALLGTYGIRWGEVKRVRFGKSHLVFDGEFRRLTVPLPAYWSGTNRTEALEAFAKFLTDSSLVPERSITADLTPNKNAKRA
jgi:hypothetical protein